MSAAAPAAGWVIARLGARTTWQASLVGFLLISLACGTAWNLPSLIVFRII